MKVLIVDDCADSTFLLSQLLTASGYESRAALDGREASAILGAWLPDAILLDLALPGECGYDLAVKLRSEFGLKDKLIVAVSGYADNAERRKAAGIDVHILKPVSASKLCEILDGWKCSLAV